VSIRTTKPAMDEEGRLRDRVEHFLVEAHELPDLELDARIDAIERTTAFLVDILLPHTAVEQHVLYPLAARLLGEEDASDAVADDRAALRELIARLVSADPADPGAIQEVLWALYARLSAHFWREEELIVKLARLGDEERVHAVVDGLDNTAGQRRFAR
jgi:Hemerythrin HHE cation binding domain